MTAALGLVALILHVALMLAAAPGIEGLTTSVVARLLGGRGAPIRQPYRDAARLWRKQAVLPEGASWLFRAAPAAQFAALAAAAALVPSFARGMVTAPTADLVAVLGLLAAARAIGDLAALDAGTANPGRAARASLGGAVLAEPALLLAAIALALAAGSTNVDAIAAAVRDGVAGRGLPVATATLAAVAVALALAGGGGGGGGAGLAEYGGRALALMRWNAALRRLVWMTLAGALAAPAGMADATAPTLWPLGLGAWVVRILVLSAAMALVSVLAVRWSERGQRTALGVALLLSLLAVVIMFAGQGAA